MVYSTSSWRGLASLPIQAWNKVSHIGSIMAATLQGYIWSLCSCFELYSFIFFSFPKRLVSNEFDVNQSPTTKKSEYFPSLFINENLFEVIQPIYNCSWWTSLMIFSMNMFQLKVIDLPAVPCFPATNVAEWNDYRFFGLRSAAAYLLVWTMNLITNHHDIPDYSISLPVLCLFCVKK